MKTDVTGLKTANDLIDGCCAVLTGGCNGLCDAEETLAKLHQDPNCTKAVTADLPMLDSYYDFSAVGCIKVGEDGNVNKTSCFQ